MSRCLESRFEFVLVLRAGEGRASKSCKLFVFHREIVIIPIEEDYWAKAGLAEGAVPTSLELHVRARADGRRARLFEVQIPTQARLQELGLSNHLDAQSQTDVLP